MGCSISILQNLYLWLFLISLLVGGSSGAWIEALLRRLMPRKTGSSRGSVTLALFLAVAASAVLLASVLMLNLKEQNWNRELLLFIAPVFVSGLILSLLRRFLLLPVAVLLLFGGLQLRSDFLKFRKVVPDLVLEHIQVNLADQNGFSFQWAGSPVPLDAEGVTLQVRAEYLKPGKLLFFLPSCGFIRILELSDHQLSPVASAPSVWPNSLTGRLVDRLDLWEVRSLDAVSGQLLSFTDYDLKIGLHIDGPELYFIPADADS